MKINLRRYSELMNADNITVMYNGPIWAGGIDGMVEMLLKRLEYEELPMSASQSILSVFVEQMNNMLMYSAEKESEISKGIFILGVKDAAYFIQTGNAVTKSNAAILQKRIDHLNTLDKKQLRQFFKERVKSDNENPESKGAGLGLIEISRRASKPLEYEFEPLGDELLYFTMYITIKQEAKK